MRTKPSPRNPVPKLTKGDMVKIVWQDACEGHGGSSLVDIASSTLRQLVTSNVTTVGRYLRIIGSYMVLNEVLREESDQKILYEQKAQGKWLAIPLNSIDQITLLGNIDPYLISGVRRRRTIFKQLRFIPRSQRLSTGDISRTLYPA